VEGRGSRGELIVGMPASHVSFFMTISLSFLAFPCPCHLGRQREDSPSFHQGSVLGFYAQQGRRGPCCLLGGKCNNPARLFIQP
jgi:hypothetical protein